MKFSPQPWQGDLAALIAGALLPLAFAPFSLFFIAVLSPAILFVVWRQCTPLRAFWRGWLFGVGQFGVGVYWVFISLYQFGGMPLAGALILTVLFILLMSFYPALLGWMITRYFPSCNHVRLLAVLPAAWVLLEWVRSWLFSGFPWLLLGYSQIDTPLGGLAPFTGVYGVSWAVAFSASLLMLLWMRGITRRAAWMEAGPPLLSIWLFSGVLGFLSGTEPIGDPINVALVQGNITQDFKWDPQYASVSVERYLALTEKNLDADVVVWPETAVPYFSHEQATWALAAKLEFWRDKHNTEFVFGIREYSTTEKKYYNSIFSIARYPGVYRKRHLVPFGEYVPFRATLGNIMRWVEAPVYEDFAVGDHEQPALILQNREVGAFICYEDAFSKEAMRTLPVANFLLNLSNDGWFGQSIAPAQHLEIARMRALETGRYLIRATNTGVTAVMDHKGRIIAHLPPNEVAVLRAAIQPTRGETMYTIAGNLPLLFLLIMAIIVGVVLEYYWHLPVQPADLRDYPTLLKLSDKKRNQHK